MSEFSERLTALREEKGWSKTHVAKQLGMSSMQTYANWEYGRTEPDFENITKIANLFDVTTDYLLGRLSPKSNIQKPLTVKEALGTIMSYDGKEVTDHDRKVMEEMMEAYLRNRGMLK